MRTDELIRLARARLLLTSLHPPVKKVKLLGCCLIGSLITRQEVIGVRSEALGVDGCASLGACGRTFNIWFP